MPPIDTLDYSDLASDALPASDNPFASDSDKASTDSEGPNPTATEKLKLFGRPSAAARQDLDTHFGNIRDSLAAAAAATG